MKDNVQISTFGGHEAERCKEQAIKNQQRLQFSNCIAHFANFARLLYQNPENIYEKGVCCP